MVVLLSAAAVLAGYGSHVATLIAFSFREDQYSYIVLIPIVSLALIHRRRRVIFAQAQWAVGPGLTLIAIGLAGSALGARLWPPDSVSFLSAMTACLWLVLVGTLTLGYGTRVVRSALFPILFLALIVPVPPRLLQGASLILQKASCELTYLLMTLGGTPVLQKGFVLTTPETSIQVAEQCSGIRSTLGLLIGSLVAGHLFLQSTWKRTLLALCVIPVSIFKNAVRIVTLYWLGVRTDQRFLTGELHHYGGIPFSVLAIGILGPLLWALRRSEMTPIVPSSPRFVRR